MPAPASSTAFFDQSPGVLVQLVNSAGACWTSEFTAPAKKNEGDRFKDIER
jgi:hypothetical protein